MILLIATAVILTGMLCGCGSSKNENMEAGMNALMQLDYEAAMSHFALAREKGEDASLIYRGEGICHLAKTEYEMAQESFLNALHECDGRLTDLEYDINFYLAAAYYRNGQVEEAVQVYDNILKLRKNEVKAYYLRGCALLEQGDYDKAQADFDKAMSLSPNDYDQMVDIYLILESYGYQEAGREILLQVMEEKEKSMSDYDRGRFCYHLGDFEAGKLYLESAAATPTEQVILYLGKTYEALGDYNYAISIYNTYLVNQSKNAVIYNQMGLCQMKMEKYTDALASFKAGMNLEDKTLLRELKFNEIVAYEYLQDFRTATVLMAEYLKSYPDDEAAKREYEFLKTR